VIALSIRGGLTVVRSGSSAATKVSPLAQRVVSRNRLTFYIPQVLFWFSIVDIIWEVIKENRPRNPAPPFPWSVTLFSLSIGVTAAGIAGSFLLARSQFARATRPVLGFFQDERDAGTHLRPKSRWTVRITNGGPGACTIQRCEWRYTLVGQETGESWLSWQETIDGLAVHSLAYGSHYYIINFGPGAVLSGNVSQQLEIAAFGAWAISVLESFEIRMRVVDLAGDVHERTGDLLRTARPITGIAPKQIVSATRPTLPGQPGR
jgi:hypothetical protein